MEVGGREFLHLGQLQQTGFSFLYTVGHPPAAASVRYIYINTDSMFQIAQNVGLYVQPIDFI